MSNISRKAKRAALASPSKPRRQPRAPALDHTNDPLFRVISDMETPLRDLENLIDTLLWVAMGLEANFNEAARAIYVMSDALSDKASAIRAVWQQAHDNASSPAREG